MQSMFTVPVRCNLAPPKVLVQGDRSVADDNTFMYAWNELVGGLGRCLMFAIGVSAVSLRQCDNVRAAIVQDLRGQSVWAGNTHIGYGFHTGLQPGAIEIAEYEFEAYFLEPPRWCFCDFSFNAANLK